MDEKVLGKIVNEVFQQAKKEHASHSKFGLSNHISNETDLSSRTLERAYDRYINNKQKYGIPQAESIDLFCKYLGYEDFGDYVKRNPKSESDERRPIKEKSSKQKSIILISIAFGMILLIYGTQNWFHFTTNNNSFEDKCMTWADSLYMGIPCNTGPFSDYGTKVEPFDEMKLKNFRLVKVSQSYPFFSEDSKPMIWYFKNKEGEIEYFTAPGLHPITGKTLDEITPYIIQKYVPLHSNKEDSFINEEEKIY